VVEPPLNLWSHFFRVRLRHDSGTGAASLGSVEISVHTGPGAEPYFVPQPEPPVGWWTAWLLLMDEAKMPLPMFTCSCPVPHPGRELSMARTKIPRLQHLLEIVWGLLKNGLTDEEILQTFIHRGVQSLRQREAVGAPPGLSCLLRPLPSQPDARRRETPVPRDSSGQEARRACIERLQLQRLKRRVEDDLELRCW
jgi:hypothetical protein